LHNSGTMKKMINTPIEANIYQIKLIYYIHICLLQKMKQIVCYLRDFLTMSGLLATLLHVSRTVQRPLV